MRHLAILLKESWATVEEHADELAQNFYARLFLADPGMRDLFPVEMAAQRSRLLSALVAVLQMVDDHERFDEVLSELGREHRKFHVQPHHYAAFGTALLGALRQYAGRHWSIEYDQAWRDAYDSVATKMLLGAERDSCSPPFWHADIVAHERRGRDIAVITCRPFMRYEFQAGQYASVECPHHPRVWRTYSIANAPRRDGTLDFHVRGPQRGWVSAALVRRSKVGDIVKLGPPRGAMTLDMRSQRDIVCVAGGTGLAPIKSLVDQLTSVNRTRWVHVFWGVRNGEDLYDLTGLTELASRFPWLSVVTACGDDQAYADEHGNVDEVMERYGPWLDHDVFVAGPPAMIRSTLERLARMGVAHHRVRYDAAAARADQ